MFSEELKKCTHQVHTRVEKRLVARIRKIQTVQDYIELLELMYGYYEPLQKRVSPFLQAPAETPGGRLPQQILNDILELQPHHDLAIGECTDLPRITSRAASLGALYVTEGSTLGGKYIAKMISSQLNISTAKGFSFFNAYGAETENMWKDFKTMLDAHAEEGQHETTTAAIETFTKFNDWIAQYEQGNN